MNENKTLLNIGVKRFHRIINEIDFNARHHDPHRVEILTNLLWKALSKPQKKYALDASVKKITRISYKYK